LDDLRNVLETLGDKDLAYVVARSNAFSVKAALDDAGLNKSYYYEKTQEQRDYVDDIATRLRRESSIRAMMILRDAAITAAEVKVSGLKDRDSRVKQAASTEILDRTVGKAADKLDVTSGGNVITVTLKDLND
jgi:hypothetical protein